MKVVMLLAASLLLRSSTAEDTKRAVVDAAFPLQEEEEEDLFHDDSFEIRESSESSESYESYEWSSEEEDEEEMDLEEMLDALREEEFFKDEKDMAEMRGLWKVIREQPAGTANEVQREALQRLAGAISSQRETAHEWKEDSTLPHNKAQFVKESKAESSQEKKESQEEENEDEKEKKALKAKLRLLTDEEEPEMSWLEKMREILPPLADLFLIVGTALVLLWLFLFAWKRFFDHSETDSLPPYASSVSSTSMSVPLPLKTPVQ